MRVSVCVCVCVCVYSCYKCPQDPRVSAVVITRRGKIANEALYKLAYIVFQLARCSGILDRVLFVISSPEQIPIVQCAVVAVRGNGCILNFHK